MNTSRKLIKMQNNRSGHTNILLRLLEVPDVAQSNWTGNWQLHDAQDGRDISLIATSPDTIRFDGLFDSFFETYWARFTALKSVSLKCRVQGPVAIRLLRRDATTGVETCVSRWETEFDSQEQTVTIELPLASAHNSESRLIAELTAIAAGARITAPQWVTRQKPARDVRLGVVITTFNRESFVARNLQRLVGRLDGGRLIVINHGSPGLSSRMPDTLQIDPSISFIDQENSGGAGGFTRGMVEHFAAGDITHILLMDDDIELMGDLVERVTAVLSYADANYCLGGAMFDFHCRSQLFSAGDILLPDSFGIAHIVPAEGCDILQSSGVDFLTLVHQPDFNGWWCFAFPVEAMEAAGLPIPCFIRGDDVEYGYRLKRTGWPTLSWPGLAVWHMPFKAKEAAWQIFYDRRNSLFANTIHRRVGLRATLGKLVGGFILHLLRYDYARVEAMTRGIAAFNQGSDAMVRWSHQDHVKLIAAIDSKCHVLGLAALDSSLPRCSLQPLAKKIRGMTIAVRFAIDLLWPWRRTTVTLLASSSCGVGMRVAVEFHPVSDGFALPYFHPA